MIVKIFSNVKSTHFVCQSMHVHIPSIPPFYPGLIVPTLLMSTITNEQALKRTHFVYVVDLDSVSLPFSFLFFKHPHTAQEYSLSPNEFITHAGALS